MGKFCCKGFILMEIWKPSRFEFCPFWHSYIKNQGLFPFATQLTCHFLWEVVFEDAIPQCCVLSQPVGTASSQLLP